MMLVYLLMIHVRGSVVKQSGLNIVRSLTSTCSSTTSDPGCLIWQLLLPGQYRSFIAVFILGHSRRDYLRVEELRLQYGELRVLICW